MAGTTPHFNFKPIIIGGSVAGLTLAHMFERANIDYILLEARDTLSPSIGSSIVIMANGARILDQLGLYEEMKDDFMMGMKRTFSRREDGTVVSSNQWPTIVQKRLEYISAICERWAFLKSLFDQLGDKTKIRTSKKVLSIEHGETSVTVSCEDGSRFTGDIVIGADGIHSRTRQEMQKFAEKTGPAGLLEKDKKSITAEYNCFFGTASPNTTLTPGDSHTASSIAHSGLLFVGKDQVPQWFFFSKMPRRYIGASNIPRFTRSGMEAQAALYRDFHFTENVTLGQLMETTDQVSFFPLEEASHDVWTYGRFVCVGDSIHKMTPNMGQGGNQAIESAAVLTNCLMEMLMSKEEKEPGTKVRNEEIEGALVKYQELRQQRAKMVVGFAAGLTRSDALDTLKYTLQFLFKPPPERVLADFSTELFISAPCLEFLPQPARISGNKFWAEDDTDTTAPSETPNTGEPIKARL
ncbi:hypothetical protein VTL71DRAFT_14171 [Oculimacula yallundae]|uniref:FAD-binding domain-containing protein n=1 Tax=Oculimacula yallundae TaxID=86028 RepID=A0ABR4CIF1_9HELO